VTISGSNLGSGSDITTVNIVGDIATIQQQTRTSVVVLCHAHNAGAGDIIVKSISFGRTTANSAFTYNIGMSKLALDTDKLQYLELFG